MGMRQGHVQGHRGQEFVELIRDVPRGKILCVSIDVHKYYHLVMVHSDIGEIVTPTLRIDVLQAGFGALRYGPIPLPLPQADGLGSGPAARWAGDVLPPSCAQVRSLVPIGKGEPASLRFRITMMS